MHHVHTINIHTTSEHTTNIHKFYLREEQFFLNCSHKTAKSLKKRYFGGKYFIVLANLHIINVCWGPVRPVWIYFPILTGRLYIIPYIFTLHASNSMILCVVFI